MIRDKAETSRSCLYETWRGLFNNGKLPSSALHRSIGTLYDIACLPTPALAGRLTRRRAKDVVRGAVQRQAALQYPNTLCRSIGF